MRQPLHIALNWRPVSELAPHDLTADIITRMRGNLRDGTPTLGGECKCKREIDELIDELIQDLEIARKEAHRGFDL